MSLSDSGLVMPAIPSQPRSTRSVLTPEILAEIRKNWRDYSDIPANIPYFVFAANGNCYSLKGERLFGIKMYRYTRDTVQAVHGTNTPLLSSIDAKQKTMAEIRKIYKSYDDIPVCMSYSYFNARFCDLSDNPHGDQVFGIRVYRIGSKTWTHGANLLKFKKQTVWVCSGRTNRCEVAEPMPDAKPPLVPASKPAFHMETKDLSTIKQRLFNNSQIVHEYRLAELIRPLYEPPVGTNVFQPTKTKDLLAIQNQIDAINAQPAPPPRPAKPVETKELSAIKDLVMNTGQPIPEKVLADIRKIRTLYEPSVETNVFRYFDEAPASLLAAKPPLVPAQLTKPKDILVTQDQIDAIKARPPIPPRPAKPVPSLAPEIRRWICFQRREYAYTPATVPFAIHGGHWVLGPDIEPSLLQRIIKTKAGVHTDFQTRLSKEILDAIRDRRPTFVAPPIVPFNRKDGQFWSVYVDAPLRLFKPVRPGKTSLTRAVLARIKARGRAMKPRRYPNAVYTHHADGTMQWDAGGEHVGTLTLINLGDMIRPKKTPKQDPLTTKIANIATGYFASFRSKTPKDLAKDRPVLNLKIAAAIRLRRREYPMKGVCNVSIKDGDMWCTNADGHVWQNFAVQRRHRDMIKKRNIDSTPVKPAELIVADPGTLHGLARKNFNLKYVAVALSFNFWSWICGHTHSALFRYKDATVVADITDLEIKELLATLKRLPAVLPGCLWINGSSGRNIFCATIKFPIRTTETIRYTLAEKNAPDIVSRILKDCIHWAMIWIMTLLAFAVNDGPANIRVVAFLVGVSHLANVLVDIVADELAKEPRDRVKLTGTLDKKLFV